jgi:hypothetical protein
VHDRYFSLANRRWSGELKRAGRASESLLFRKKSQKVFRGLHTGSGAELALGCVLAGGVRHGGGEDQPSAEKVFGSFPPCFAIIIGEWMSCLKS